jgi:hypothetical protein
MEEDNPFQTAQTVDPEVRAYVYSLVNAVSNILTPRFHILTMPSLVVAAPMRLADMSSVMTPLHACEI